MKNPIKFLQEVKQEAFKVSWPTGKETVQGALMVFAMAVVMSLFFLLIDQVLKFFSLLLAGAEGLEPSASGFGDRRSTN